MSSIILGTGASEGIPALFCSCPVCEDARKVGGKAVRSRSDFLIDEENLIDFCPDIFLQCINAGIDLRGLKNIFLTHFHEDHMCIDNLMMLKNCVKIYGNEKAIELIKEALPIYRIHGWAGAPDYFKGITWMPLEPFCTYEIDGLSVTPVVASHEGYAKDEVGYNYIIRDKAGKLFLYATDTGWYREETWNYLKGCGCSFDYVVMECTYGDYKRPEFEAGHLDFGNLSHMLVRMKEFGMIAGTTPVYLTHICHLNKTPADSITKMFEDKGFCVIPAFDGMKI